MADQNRHFDTDETSQDSNDDGETSQDYYDDGETSQASNDGETSRSSTFEEHNPRRRENLPRRQPDITTEEAGLQETTRQADRRFGRNDEPANPHQQRPSLFANLRSYFTSRFANLRSYFTSEDFRRRRFYSTFSCNSIGLAIFLAWLMFFIYMCSSDSTRETSEVSHRKYRAPDLNRSMQTAILPHLSEIRNGTSHSDD